MVLPDQHELFAALCGHLGEDVQAHPVTRCARGLVELHKAHRGCPLTPEFRHLRTWLIEFIDQWVQANAPFAANCEDSLGDAVDRMACAHLDAVALLWGESGPREALHAAWHNAGALADEWTDLVSEVIDGQPRRPRTNTSRQHDRARMP
ncbi:hypothetical protein IU469_32285 [Nocardia puris]|uniref:hypothetical protein n=1 Tax=Nocardia puris TaxID=208602 RepID=UPI0018953496|nr:hypothetical protein [Nocardia puris]MBF6370346.1 hypothetical protein [Nocardia puris]